jgi:ABC-type bacteriocin/lantibiotic exporter with double-glycine peptidase domain
MTAPLMPMTAAPPALSEPSPVVPREGLPWVLPRLTELLGRRFTHRRLLDALPHAVDSAALPAVIGAATRLGLAPRRWQGRSHRLPAAVLPALWATPEGSLAVVVARTECHLLVEEAPGAPLRRVHAVAVPGSLYVFAGREEAELGEGWPLLRQLLAENASPIAGLLALSVLSSIASIALGLVVMIAFDMVIPGGQLAALALLGIGFVLAMAIDLAARIMLARGVGRLGERAERRVLGLVFEKVLRLPWQNLASQDPAAQVMRMREVESAREVFTGPLPHLLLQLPLALLFLLAIWALAGLVVVVPLALLPVQILAATILVPRARERERRAGLLSTERRRMMLETLSHAATLRAIGAEAAWLARFREISGAAAAAHAQAARAAHAVETVAQVGLPVAAAGMSTVGAALVIQGSISPGALVAAIMLAWRLLVPMQSFLLAASRARQVADSVRQLHRLQALRGEARPAVDAPNPVLRGHALRFEGIVCRAANGAPPVLAGVSLLVPQGARVAITGPSGAGKSTLLRVALGILAPQAGAVMLGGVNIAQLEPATLRARIGYLPQRPALIYGTIAQNLRLSAPLAEDGELSAACEAAGILEEIRALPEGFGTRLNDIAKESLPQSLRQGIALAQALLRRPDILLLDDPTLALDRAREARLQALLAQIHGQVSVLMVTHRADLIRGADAVYLLERGSLAAVDPAGPARRRAQHRTPD